MKQHVSILLSATLIVVLVAGVPVIPGVWAQDGQNSQKSTQEIICKNVPGQDCKSAGDQQGTVSRLTETVTDVLTMIIASVSVLALVVAGFMYMLSAGNPDVVNKAKNIILYAIVGIVVAAFAQVIVRFVLSSVS